MRTRERLKHRVQIIHLGQGPEFSFSGTHIGRLQVPVDHLVAMQGLEPIEQPRKDPLDLVDGEGPVGIQALLERRCRRGYPACCRRPGGVAAGASIGRVTVDGDTAAGLGEFSQVGKSIDVLDIFAIVKIQTGKFGAMMDVSLVNDGPVTIILESGNTR